MYHIFFIHSFVSGHLGCFQILATENNAPVNTGVHVSFQISVCFLYIYIYTHTHTHTYPGVELLDHVVVLVLILRGPSLLFSVVAAPVDMTLPSVLSSTSLPVFCYLLSLVDSHFVRCVILICIFLMFSDVEHLLMCLLAISVSSLEKKIVYSEVSDRVLGDFWY